MSREGDDSTRERVGFQKKRKTAPPAPRFTYAKRRADWFKSRCSWPQREAPIHLLVEGRARARELPNPAKGGGKWEMVGPTNVGGRVTCLAVHPENPDIVWVGAACGGVWKSEDAGRSWRSVWDDDAASLNIGSLAIDPQRPHILYCGTGEANLSPDSYPGVGLYRSRDSGESWELIASCADDDVPNRIGEVVVNPFDSRHICLGGVGHAPDSSEPGSWGGLWQSRDGGRSWKRDETFTKLDYWCHCIVFSRRKGVMFASFSQRSASDGVWRSKDGGRSWHHLTEGLPAPDRMDRTMIAVAPSDPNIVYAQVASAEDRMLGVFRSTNGGNTWREISDHHFQLEEQMTYGNAIVVHPQDPHRVLCGGVELHLKTKRGNAWKRVTDSYARPKKPREGKPARQSPHYAHADHHRLTIPRNKPNRVYDANDGGLAVSEDGGLTWEQRSHGLAITMFYDIDVSQQDPKVYGGGTQDNGTWLTRSGKKDDFQLVDGGDGGWMLIDPKDSKRFYSSLYNVEIYRHGHGHVKRVSPKVPNADFFWMVYLDMDPNRRSTVLVGTDRVLRTRDDGESWKAISDELDGSAISAIDIARGDSRRICVGTEHGGVFRTTDGGKNWSGNLASSVIPGFKITRIESHPTNPLVAYVTTGNFGPRHVFRTTDGGDTWTCVDEGKLPGVPCNAVVIPAWAPDDVYVASDAGVFVSHNGGRKWLDLKLNLPNVSCIDLVAQNTERTLTVATYGRSLWRLKV